LDIAIIRVAIEDKKRFISGIKFSYSARIRRAFLLLHTSYWSRISTPVKRIINIKG